MEKDKEKFKIEFQKRLINFTISVVRACDELRKENSLYYSICDQLIRSAASVGANVTEAKSSSSRKDFIKFFDIALKSANETEYWLLVVEELKPDLGDLKDIKRECYELSCMIASSLLRLKGKK